MLTINFEPVDKAELKKHTEKVLNLVKPLVSDENYNKLVEYSEKLAVVVSAYKTTMEICNDAREAQNEVFQAFLDKKYEETHAKLKPAIDKFDLLHDRITAHFGLGHNVVPPIPAGLKDQIPSDTYAIIEKTRKSVGVFKTLVDREYKKAEAENGKIVPLYNDYLKHQQEIAAKQKAANNSQQPNNPAPAKLPSSSHGFQPQQEASRAQAKAANAGNVHPIRDNSAKPRE